MDDDIDGINEDEAFRYGPIGWILGFCASVGLIWLMFALADPL